jgi:hypothetical protein
MHRRGLSTGWFVTAETDIVVPGSKLIAGPIQGVAASSYRIVAASSGEHVFTKATAASASVVAR